MLSSGLDTVAPELLPSADLDSVSDCVPCPFECEARLDFEAFGADTPFDMLPLGSRELPFSLFPDDFRDSLTVEDFREGSLCVEFFGEGAGDKAGEDDVED